MREYGAVANSRIGKIDLALCEDICIVGEHLFAVVDGATSKHPQKYTLDGELVNSGLFAAAVIGRYLLRTDATTPKQILDEATNALRQAILEQGVLLQKNQFPSASLVVFDPRIEQIWGVGDAKAAWSTDGLVYQHDDGFAIDEVLSGLRAAYLEMLAATGAPWDGKGADPGREAILPFLKNQGHLANTLGDFGYGVVNGEQINQQHIWVRNAPGVSRVVLASDGYPRLTNDTNTSLLSIQQAESYLMSALLSDPYCVGLLRSTKGLMPGQVSFDDRSWLEVVVQ